MDKDRILAEFRRCATQNGGRPLGRERFAKDTGIQNWDWGRFWVRYSDLVKEAGHSPNAMTSALSTDLVVTHFISLIRELRRFPVDAEVRMQARRCNDFPSHTTFAKHLGKTKAARVSKVLEYCRNHNGYADVAEICERVTAPEATDDRELAPARLDIGYVYLVKSGKFHKIGRSNSVGRREYELAIQLPEQAAVMHSIKTDDPVGVEAYWHNRFKEKRTNGEWFKLTADDVKAFRRWRNIG